MKKFYSIAMLLMLVASVSFFTSCNSDDDDKGVNGGDGGSSTVEIQTFTGTLKVYDRLTESSEEPNSELTVPVTNQNINMTRDASTFGLSIEGLVLEIIGMGETEASDLSISGIPYTVSSTDADICEVDYSCNVNIDILGTYATVSKVKGTFSKSSNVMDLVILAVGSDVLLNAPVYISVVCTDGNNTGDKVFTGTLKVYDRLSESSEEPNSELTVPVTNQNINMTRDASTFGLSIEGLVLEIIGMGETPASDLSISGVPYTVSSTDADICEVDYSCNVNIDILGTYATVSKVKGTFSKSSNVMDLAILAVGSEELLNVPVYISVVCQ